VNPEHLFIGTRADNAADMAKKGRWGLPRNFPTGEDWMRCHESGILRGDSHYARSKPERLARGSSHGMARLTEGDVRTIRERCLRGELQRTVGTDYEIPQATVSDIVTRRTWKHVD